MPSRYDSRLAASKPTSSELEQRRTLCLPLATPNGANKLPKSCGTKGSSSTRGWTALIFASLPSRSLAGAG